FLHPLVQRPPMDPNLHVGGGVSFGGIKGAVNIFESNTESGPMGDLGGDEGAQRFVKPSERRRRSLAASKQRRAEEFDAQTMRAAERTRLLPGIDRTIAAAEHGYQDEADQENTERVVQRDNQRRYNAMYGRGNGSDSTSMQRGIAASSAAESDRQRTR